eukprot:gene4644-4896_t
MLTFGLANLDSRGLAALLKELAKGHHGKRAREVFDFLRSLPGENGLAALCDVFTYTAMISLCVEQQELARALELVSEMRQRKVERNVHTYTALMNVAIKCNQLQKAIEIHSDMLREGCMPNVVTYNTLIDVYGKTGQWGEALRVVDQMHSSPTKPVTRTYNTLMIACNTSGQWQEALNVYHEMRRMGHAPNTTTYNALISAHSKAGRLEKVMEVYQEMLRTSCERSVITYSALISACEKAGQWQLALDLFSTMLQERCSPNVITYNSLITACAQGAQWVKAAEVFEKMQSSGCKPDVVTYTALVSAYERGGQWMKALEVFQQMQQLGCSADAILYNTLLDVLWDTGNHICQLLEGFESRGRGQAVVIIEGQLAAEAALAAKCKEVFAELKRFESTHNLNVHSMGQVYTVGRAQLVELLLEAGQQLCMEDDLVHDAVLLMDRAMSASFKVPENDLPSLAAACLHLTSGSAQLGPNAPSLSDICSAMGCSSSDEPKQMTLQLQRVLKDDTSAKSALRCLRLYLERLGCRLEPGWSSDGDDLQGLYELIVHVLKDTEFLNYRPTVTAAAVLYCERLQQGRLPFWPSSLAVLTGYSNARTPELAAAINGAQRLCNQLKAASYQHGAEARGERDSRSKGESAAPLLHETSAADMQSVRAATRTFSADEGAVLVGMSRPADLLVAEAAGAASNEETGGGAAVLEELAAMTVGSHGGQQLQQL